MCRSFCWSWEKERSHLIWNLAKWWLDFYQQHCELVMWQCILVPFVRTEVSNINFKLLHQLLVLMLVLQKKVSDIKHNGQKLRNNRFKAVDHSYTHLFVIICSVSNSWSLKLRLYLINYYSTTGTLTIVIQ